VLQTKATAVIHHTELMPFFAIYKFGFVFKDSIFKDLGNVTG